MANRSRIFGTCLVLLFLLAGCATLPEPTPHPPQFAFDRPEETGLGQLVARHANKHAGESGFLLLDTGREAFHARAGMIEAAERSIDAQYYIWNSDVSGRYLAKRLLLAADRGVRVRLLLDDINVAGRDAIIAALDRHEHIEIRVFNPFAARTGARRWLGLLSDFQRLNRRMHNKTFVADGALGIVGGRNIGDEYFDLHPTMNFRDRDVLAVGPVVRDMSANFDAYWNSRWSYPIAQLAPKRTADDKLIDDARATAGDTTGLDERPAQQRDIALARTDRALVGATWAPAELIYDAPAENMRAPADTPRETATALRKEVQQAQSEILLESAYLILGDFQLEGLEAARQRGVRVAVLTNSLSSNDLTTNHSGYARRRPAMLARGMELHELRPDAAACVVWIEFEGFCDNGAVSLHAKSAVFDRRTVFIGSFNVNLRSIYLNGETVLIIHSKALAERLAWDMELAMSPDNSWRVSLDEAGNLQWSSRGETWSHEPATGWWRRFKAGFFGLLPLESYL